MAAKGQKADKITIKQDAFALAYMETSNAAEAYRRAYDVAPDAMDSWIYVEACQLLDNPKVSLRIKELQDQAAKMSLFTVSQAYKEYEAARVLAHKEAMPAAAISAVTGKVKLFGLEPPARARLEHVGKNGGPIRTEEVSARDKLTDLITGIAARSGTGDNTGESD